MFNDLISTLTKLLSGHEYVTQVSKEKNDMLRENDKLRNDVQLLREELDKLKRFRLHNIPAYPKDPYPSVWMWHKDGALN